MRTVCKDGKSGKSTPSGPTRDYVPRNVMDMQLAALQDRCIKAEDCVVLLLTMIDADLLERHGFDWWAATQEVVG